MYSRPDGTVPGFATLVLPPIRHGDFPLLSKWITFYKLKTKDTIQRRQEISTDGASPPARPTTSLPHRSYRSTLGGDRRAKHWRLIGPRTNANLPGRFFYSYRKSSCFTNLKHHITFNAESLLGAKIARRRLRRALCSCY